MRKSIVNVEELERQIRFVEKEWDEKGLDIEDRLLVIKYLNARVQQKVDEQKASDLQSKMTENINFGSLLKKFTSKKEDEEGE